MKKVFLTLTMLLFAFVGTMRADVVEIGSLEGAANNSYLPMNSLYDYSFSEQIYTAEEIGTAGSITEITMWLYGNANLYEMPFDIYMVEVDKDAFASTSDWVTVTAADMVYSGSVTVHNTAAEAYTFTLDTPFEYSGAGNLLIAFNNNTGQWKSGLNGKVFGASGDAIRSIYSRRDGTPYDISNLPTATSTTYQRNVITLDISTSAITCAKPTQLTVDYQGDLTAQVSWTSEADAFNLKLDGNVIENVTNPYTLDNLSLGTTYEVSVQANCGSDGTSQWTNPVSFTTNLCLNEDMCEITFEVTDSYGDGWNDAAIKVVDVRTGNVLAQISNTNAAGAGEAQTYTLAVCDGRAIQFVWVAGSYDSEASYVVTDVNGIEIFSGSGAMSAPVDYTVSCAELGAYITTDPTQLDFGYRPNGAWMEPAKLTLNNLGKPTTVSNVLTDNNYFVIDAETPFNMEFGESTEIEISTGSAVDVDQSGNIFVLYAESAKESNIIPVTATAYDPVEGDVYETAIEVDAFPFNGNAPAGIYRNYNIENATADVKDAVYKVTFDQEVLLTAGTNGANGVARIFTEDFNGKPGPMVDNHYEYSTDSGYPPYDGWFGYDYTGANTFFGSSAGGGMYFGYRIPASYLAGYGQCYLTQVEDAARESYPYNLYVLRGGTTPADAELVYYQEMPEPATALYFFDMDITTPFAIGEDEDLWVMFYSESPYAAYCGKEAIDVDNAKIWYTLDGTTWYSNTTYTPVIYLHLQYPNPADRGEVVLNLADMSIKPFNGNGTVAEANGNVKNVPTHSNMMVNNNRAGYVMLYNQFVPAGTYYLVVASSDDNFDVYIQVDDVPAPVQAVVNTPADGSTNVTTPFLADWTLGDYTTEMQVLLGTQYPPQTVLVDWTSELFTSMQINELEPNQSYFMQVNARNSTGTTYGEIVAFTTPIDGVEDFAVAQANLYPGDAAEFTWTANRSFKGYNLYKDGVKVNESLITTNEYTVEDLDYNMDGYQFTLTAVYDAGESLPTDPITVQMTGTGTVSGHVYDTDVDHPVANLPITFIILDEYQQTQTFEEYVTTDENGFYTAEVLTGMVIPGIVQETGETYGYEPAIYTNYFVNVENQVVYEDIDIITHEYYYPLSQITATLQEEENNVLVEWSWDPAEMIVDFETGDFSQAEFTLPATYPWAVTTTNPHDGTYCMKSTCEGVASGSSTIEVTVDVPFEAKMGFYVRVSSESNYDKFHFYIDGIEQGAALSGALDYQYKEYNVSEGTHTYKWEYTKDSSVNSNDDCVYVDDITMYRKDEPVPPTPGATVYNFDDSSMMGWTSIDADNDGNGWVSSANPGIYHNSGVSLSGTGHNNSEAYVISGSYANQTGVALTPDNYLVSPTQISAQDGASITFYVCAQDASYAAEHFGVAVSTTGNTSGNDFTTIQEWTLTAKCPQGRTAEAERDIRGTKAQGNWYEKTVDLSSYAGQDIWVAIRHFNCTDMFILNLDDITLYDGSAKPMARSNDRSLMSYNLYRRDIQHGEDAAVPTLIAEGLNVDEYEYTDNAWANLPYGEYQWGIQATYEGYVNDRSREEATYGFEGGLEGWTVITVNTEGGEWIHSDNNLGGYDYTSHAHGGSGFAMCYSFVDYVGSFDTDSYLVSPQKYSLNSSSSISFWADNANDDYPENFSVCVATADNPTASDFTQVWSGGAKGTGNGNATVRHQNNRYDNWRSHTVDLSSYAGQEVWIAFHDVNYDMDEIWIDDVTISYAGGVTPPPTPPTPGPTGSGLSEILWSNMIPKDMEATLTFNVSLNNGQSPVGAAVLATDGDEYSFNTTVGEGGTAELEVRKGVEYTITVELEGYSTFTTTDLVEGDQSYDVVLNEIIGNVEGLYVSPTGWAKWDGLASSGVTPGPGPGPGPGAGSFSEGFESGMPDGWTVIDANNDGNTWCLTSAIPTTWTYYASIAIDWYRTGTNAICSGSYINGVGALNPDEYLVMGQQTLTAGSTLSFWAAATDAGYPADHFGVFVSDDGATNWTSVQEWTLTGKKGANDGGLASRDGKGAKLGTWYNYSVDLSAYAGQKYIAIRHFNCYDQYIMCVDDIELTNGSKGDRAPLMYKVKLDGQYDGETTFNGFQHNVEGFEEGSTHVTAVRPVYISGNGDWVEYTWTYTSCDHFEGVTDLAAAAQGNDVKLTWTMPEGTNPGPGPGPSGSSSFTEDFEGSLNGWSVITVLADGGEWLHSSQNLGGYDYTSHAHGGTGFAMCYSFVDYVGSFNTDSYLVTPQKYDIVAGSTLSFWADNANDSYPENFSVCVATADNPTASDFTQVWSGGAKGTGNGNAKVRHQDNRYDNWRAHSIDLSAYAGQSVYIAFHDVNYDMYEIWIDDVELSTGTKGSRDMWDYVASFSGTSAGQQAVCTDGTYIYTASWQTTPTGGHTFYQYTMDGTFVEGFEIAGATGIRDLTTDGEYFYGTSGASNIFILDFTTRTLVGTINCTGLTSRHISYDPERDGFWSGNWTTLDLYSRTGALLQSGPAPTSAYGSAYYKDADNVEHLYLFCQPSSDAKVYDYNITTGTLGASPVLDFATTPAFNAGIAGGCFIGAYNGNTCWYGNAQQDPNLIGIYELEAGTPGPGPGPGPQPGGEGILGAMVFRNGEPIVFLEGNPTQYIVEAAAAEDAEYGVRVVYDGEPDVTYYAMSCMETVNYNGTGGGCDPVTNLTGYYQNYQGEEGLVMEWDDPEGATSIRIYADGDLLGSVAATGAHHAIFLSFDGPTPAGTYTLGAVAVYDNCESEMVTVDVYYDDINENEVVNNLYPNPTNDKVTIEAQGMNHITVANTLGQVVYDADVDADQIELNLGQYNAGMYLVRVSTVNGVSVQRVMVVK